MPNNDWADWTAQPKAVRRAKDAGDGASDQGSARSDRFGDERHIEETSVVDMLTKPVEDGRQDEPNLSESLWYPTAGE